MFYRAQPRVLAIYDEDGEMLADDHSTPILVRTEKPTVDEEAAFIDGGRDEVEHVEQYLSPDEHLLFGVVEEQVMREEGERGIRRPRARGTGRGVRRGRGRGSAASTTRARPWRHGE